ncbi:hypothetical protein SAMN05421827_116105 [Pedobacter terrae]|uniref:Uncharacterized protein n=1 Tax=Pedobacter terrae TaxID=405671 RepID=A0A1G7ZM04_9SPHI|nr:hypothetical protein SAMN05421827_116105 [Pedobacter terrae]
MVLWLERKNPNELTIKTTMRLNLKRRVNENYREY